MKRFLMMMTGPVLVFAAMLGAVAWFTLRVYVPPDSCAVLIRKMGRPLPPGQLVATEPGQQGIQFEVLGPGRYFYNPVVWDYEIKPLLNIPSGDPRTWHSAPQDPGTADRSEASKAPVRGSNLPMIGVVTRKVGLEPPPGQTLVTRASGMRGVLEEVLTPGRYKLNPYVFEVELRPAVVIPSGYVGVVTNLFGDQPESTRTPLLPELSGESVREEAEVDVAAEEEAAPVSYVRPLARPGERGTLADVLQPGVYFINPRLRKVTPIEIGFNEYSQIELGGTDKQAISFPSDTGYLIQVAVTVVWGIDPRHAAQVINEFGNVDGVLDKVIGPQLRSICRNIGSTYAARDFIQGEKREQFQKDLTRHLRRVCRGKNIEVLLALVRDLEVHAPSGGLEGGEVTEDLKRTIQQSFVAVEKQLTKEKQREAATVRARLEEELKKVDIARETIKSETRVLVADALADGQKQAALIDAETELKVATIQQSVAELDAKRTRLLGGAAADVERMSKDAEAKGYELLVGAFGGGQAYNLYTFAENFRPESIRLFYAGEGTFWTDLTRFQDVGAAEVLRRTAPSGTP